MLLFLDINFILFWRWGQMEFLWELDGDKFLIGWFLMGQLSWGILKWMPLLSEKELFESIERGTIENFDQSWIPLVISSFRHLFMLRFYLLFFFQGCQIWHSLSKHKIAGQNFLQDFDRPSATPVLYLVYIWRQNNGLKAPRIFRMIQ